MEIPTQALNHISQATSLSGKSASRLGFFVEGCQCVEVTKNYIVQLSMGI